MDAPTAGQYHQHSSAQARAIAERGTILRTQVGSGAHGTSITGQDDRDEMGVCLEPPQFITGIARIGDDVPGTDRTVPFDQYEYHSAWERPGGLDNRSGAGDLDVIIYSARKYLRLALSGNPTVLIPLFASGDDVVAINDAGRELRDNAHRIASRRAASRFIGYLASQRRAMTGGSGAHTNRPELVALHGYDTKFAMHALRLGVQGVEYLRTGRITLPIPEPNLTRLRQVRAGEWQLPTVLDWADSLESELRDLETGSPLPDLPDYAWVNQWLHRSYTVFWQTL
ncbi:MAG: nucleotidyltransferase domain-containing protein [Actinomycetota bacterium]